MKKLITITSLIFIVAFVFSVNLFAQDLTLTTDGKVPGKPFEALQQQIDALQIQINDVNNPVLAFTNSSYLDEFPQDTTMDIINLDLPAGHFIMTITMGASFFHDGVYNADYHTYMHCDFVDDEGSLVTGYGFGGGFTGHDSLAKTIPISIDEPTNIILRCEHSCGYDDPLPNDPLSYSIEWNAIKVDDLNNQVTNE
jgi:hypothetical protein